MTPAPWRCWLRPHDWYVVGRYGLDTLHIGCGRCGRYDWYCYDFRDPGGPYRITSETRLAKVVQEWRAAVREGR